jgi:hypothetical protein
MPLSTGAGLVDPSRLRLGDAFELTLAAQVGLELGEHAQHVEEALSGGGAGVDRLLGRLEGGAARADRADDVLQIADAPGQAIDAGDHENVPGVQKFQHGAECLTSLGRGPAPLLGPDDLTTALSAASWMERSWSVVLTLAYPMTVMVAACCLVWF